jgi:cytochrome P450
MGVNSTNTWAFSRNTEIFGSDPEYFRPERWLGVSAEEHALMERTTDILVFGYGRYRCLGASVAWMELNKVFVEILRQFDITPLNPSSPMTSVSHGVWLQSEFMVRIVERDLS